MNLKTLSVLLLCAGSPLVGADGLPLNGVAHVALRVSDVAKSREFYRVLGWDQAFEFSDDKGTATSYVKVNDRQFIELYRRTAPTDVIGLMHLCMEAADLDGVAAAYQKAGVTTTDRRKARAGNLLFNIRDAEGNLIEYTQYLPGSLHMNENGKHVLAERLSDHLIRASLPVKSVAAESAFFNGKLGFNDLGNGLMGAPGTSSEQVKLETSTADWRARLVFEVADVRRTADELKKRGVKFDMSGDSIALRDPDGAILVFSAKR